MYMSSLMHWDALNFIIIIIISYCRNWSGIRWHQFIIQLNLSITHNTRQLQSIGIIALYSINPMILIIEAPCVLCEVQISFLYIL